MKQTKTEFKWFTILQYNQEEEYLSTMHKNGWKLTKVSFPGFYHFSKCKPENVTYRLDYNQEGIAHKSEYVQLFADCGWEYMFDFVGYSYFRKASDDAEVNEEIFCDEQSRLDMMKRVFKGRIVPLIILFVCGLLPQCYLNPIGYESGHIVRQALSYVIFGLSLVYVIFFLVLTSQFYQYEKKIFPGKDNKIKYGGIFATIIASLLLMAGIVLWTNHSDYRLIDTERGFIIEAELLNKAIIKEYELNAGDRIYVCHEGEGGELYLSIGETDTQPIFFGNTFDEFGEFEVEVKEGGIYQIKCIGNKAQGVIEIELK